MEAQLPRVDGGVAGVRHVVDLVEPVGEEAVLVAQTLGEDAKELVRQEPLVDAIQVPEPGHGAPAQEHGAEHVLLRPVDDAAQLVPVVDLQEVEVLHGCPGDDHAVVVLVLERVERVVELDQVVLTHVRGLVRGDAHEVAAHLQRRLADEAEDLGLGLDLGGHEVEDDHPERANLLLGGRLFLEGEDSLLPQDLLGGKAIWDVDGHVCLLGWCERARRTGA
jgi:hypothetical protein